MDRALCKPSWQWIWLLARAFIGPDQFSKGQGLSTSWPCPADAFDLLLSFDMEILLLLACVISFPLSAIGGCAWNIADRKCLPLSARPLFVPPCGDGNVGLLLLPSTAAAPAWLQIGQTHHQLAPVPAWTFNMKHLLAVSALHDKILITQIWVSMDGCLIE